MIESEHGVFTLVHNHKDAFEMKTFNDRYVDYFNKFLYIVGDFSAQMLRLKGFHDKEEALIADYLMESAVPNAPYFILKRVEQPKEVTGQNDEDLV